MRPEEIAVFLSAFRDASEEQPFGPSVDVYKVAGKMFAIFSPEGPHPSLSLKCEPSWAAELRARYTAVVPGYHLNKLHWNTIVLDGTVPDRQLRLMITHSYDRVVSGLPKSVRVRLTDEE